MTGPTAGVGPNALHIESSLSSSIPTCGTLKRVPIPLTDFRQSSGVALPAVGSNIVGLGTIAVGSGNDHLVLSWDDTADEDDTAHYQMMVPPDYNDEADNLCVVLNAQHLLGGAANTDLTLGIRARAGGINAGAGIDLSTGPVQRGFNRTVNTFEYYPEVYNFSGLGLKPFDSLHFVLAPNETLGPANFLRVLGAEVWYNGHANLNAKYERVFETGRLTQFR